MKTQNCQSASPTSVANTLMCQDKHNISLIKNTSPGKNLVAFSDFTLLFLKDDYKLQIVSLLNLEIFYLLYCEFKIIDFSIMCNSPDLTTNPFITDFIAVLLENGEIRTYQLSINKQNNFLISKITTCIIAEQQFGKINPNSKLMWVEKAFMILFSTQQIMLIKGQFLSKLFAHHHFVEDEQQGYQIYSKSLTKNIIDIRWFKTIKIIGIVYIDNRVAFFESTNLNLLRDMRLPQFYNQQQQVMQLIPIEGPCFDQELRDSFLSATMKIDGDLECLTISSHLEITLWSLSKYDIQLKQFKSLVNIVLLEGEYWKDQQKDEYNEIQKAIEQPFTCLAIQSKLDPQNNVLFVSAILPNEKIYCFLLLLSSSYLLKKHVGVQGQMIFQNKQKTTEPDQQYFQNIRTYVIDNSCSAFFSQVTIDQNLYSEYFQCESVYETLNNKFIEKTSAFKKQQLLLTEDPTMSYLCISLNVDLVQFHWIMNDNLFFDANEGNSLIQQIEPQLVQRNGSKVVSNSPLPIIPLNLESTGSIVKEQIIQQQEKILLDSDVNQFEKPEKMFYENISQSIQKAVEAKKLESSLGGQEVVKSTDQQAIDESSLLPLLVQELASNPEFLFLLKDKLDEAVLEEIKRSSGENAIQEQDRMESISDLKQHLSESEQLIGQSLNDNFESLMMTFDSYLKESLSTENINEYIKKAMEGLINENIDQKVFPLIKEQAQNILANTKNEFFVARIVPIYQTEVANMTESLKQMFERACEFFKDQEIQEQLKLQSFHQLCSSLKLELNRLIEQMNSNSDCDQKKMQEIILQLQHLTTGYESLSRSIELGHFDRLKSLEIGISEIKQSIHGNNQQMPLQGSLLLQPNLPLQVLNNLSLMQQQLMITQPININSVHQVLNQLIQQFQMYIKATLQ